MKMTLLYLFLFNLILGLEVIEDDSLLFESAEQVCIFFRHWINYKTAIACRKSGPSGCRTSHCPRFPANTWLQVEFIEKAATRSRKSCRWSSRESCCCRCYHDITKRKHFQKVVIVIIATNWLIVNIIWIFSKGKKKESPSIIRANDEGKLWISKEHSKLNFSAP